MTFYPFWLSFFFRATKRKKKIQSYRCNWAGRVVEERVGASDEKTDFWLEGSVSTISKEVGKPSRVVKGKDERRRWRLNVRNEYTDAVPLTGMKIQLIM